MLDMEINKYPKTFEKFWIRLNINNKQDLIHLVDAMLYIRKKYGYDVIFNDNALELHCKLQEVDNDKLKELMAIWTK